VVDRGVIQSTAWPRQGEYQYPPGQYQNKGSFGPILQTSNADSAYSGNARTPRAVITVVVHAKFVRNLKRHEQRQLAKRRPAEAMRFIESGGIVVDGMNDDAPRSDDAGRRLALAEGFSEQR
jgi:hypothetical protein